jgi:pimeloyl-ACP methyl ester carboxylesterase
MPLAHANGIDIEYESIGRVGDPAILLIMGFAASIVLWPNALIEGLAARGFRVIRFDNRDIGRSTHLAKLGAPDITALMTEVQAGRRPAAPYTLDDMAADSAGLMDALGIERAHIVGASMGGMIAQLMAINYPARTKSLVSIMSTTARPGLPAAKPETMAVITARPASTSREDLIENGMKIAHALGSPGFPATEAELLAKRERLVDWAPYDPVGILRQMAAVVVAQPRNSALAKLTIPTLVIHGADDPLVPVAHGEDTARSIPGAALLIVPGLAHDFRESTVPVYLKAIADFVTKVEARERAVA